MNKFENYLYFRKFDRLCQNSDKISNKYFRWFSEKYYPFIKKYALPLENYHGYGHLIETVAFALYLSKFIPLTDIQKCDLIQACAFHDIRRNNEKSHGLESICFIDSLDTFSCNFSVREAIINHNNNTSTNNIILKVLRDADRIRLSWERGFNRKYFSSSSAEVIAQLPLKKQREFLDFLLEWLQSYDEELCLSWDSLIKSK